MHKNRLWLVMMALALGALARAHDDDENRPAADAAFTPEEQMVVAVVRAYAEAYAATDIEAIGALTVADETFSYFEDAGADLGWADHAEHLGKEMPAFSETRYSVFGLRPTVADRMALVTFEWELGVVVLSEQFEGGRHPVSMSGLGTAVLINGEAGWRILHMHTARKRS